MWGQKHRGSHLHHQLFSEAEGVTSMKGLEQTWEGKLMGRTKNITRDK